MLPNTLEKVMQDLKPTKIGIRIRKKSFQIHNSDCESASFWSRSDLPFWISDADPDFQYFGKFIKIFFKKV